MEKSFSPFSDYFGLSSIIQQDEDKTCKVYDHSTLDVVSSVPHDYSAWLDRRLEEIIHKYKEKMSLNGNNSQICHSNNYLNQQKTVQSPNVKCGSQLGLSHKSLSLNQNSYGPIPTYSSNNNRSIQFSPTGFPTMTSQPMNVSPPPSYFPFSSAPSTPILNSTGSSPAHSPFASQVLMGQSLLSTQQSPTSLQQSNPNEQEIKKEINTSGVMSQLQQQPNHGCSFCRNNKEVEEWVMSHQLKDALNRVTCPILRSYVCPLCYASGDNAHTLGHCPLNPDKNSSLPLAVRRRSNATGKVKL
ncbi:uncharacterized protein LOC143446367 [Clavelina lepadiformis]